MTRNILLLLLYYINKFIKSQSSEQLEYQSADAQTIKYHKFIKKLQLKIISSQVIN